MDVCLRPPVLAADRSLYPVGSLRLGPEPGNFGGEPEPGGRDHRGEFSGDRAGGRHLRGSGRVPDFYQCSEVPSVFESPAEGDQ